MIHRICNHQQKKLCVCVCDAKKQDARERKKWKKQYSHRRKNQVLFGCAQKTKIFAAKELCDQKLCEYVFCVCLCMLSNDEVVCVVLLYTVNSLSQKTKFVFGADGWTLDMEGEEKTKAIVLHDDGKMVVFRFLDGCYTSRCFGKMQTVCVCECFFPASKMGLCSH